MKVLILAAFLAALQICRADNVLTKQKLFKDQADGYDPNVDPGHGTHVKVGVSFICANLDEKTHKLTTRVYERYSWVDKRLTWNASDFDGIKKISVPIDHSWRPDIRLFNAFGREEDRNDVNGVFLSDGTVFWIPPATYTSLCSASESKRDHSYHCSLVLGPWTHDGPSLPLELFEGGFDTKMYLKECPYVIKNTKAVISYSYYDCCPERFEKLELNFDVVENDHHDDDDDHDDDHHDDDDDHHDGDKKDDNCRWPHCD